MRNPVRPSDAKPRPRILIDATPLCSGSGLRGVGRYVRDLLYGLSAARDEWTPHLGISALYGLSLTGAPRVTEDLRLAADTAYQARGTQESDLYVARRLRLAGVARAAGAKLLHLPEALGTPLVASCPSLVTCHDLIPLCFPEHYLAGAPWKRPWRAVKDRWRYHRATHVVCISDRTSRDLGALLGVPAERREVILHGIDLDAFCASANDGEDQRQVDRFGLGARPYLLYAGYSDYRKNVEGMLRALAIARRSVDVDLAWAGRLPPKEQRKIASLAEVLGVSDAVRLLDYVPDEVLPALFRRATAHLFLSRLEGFGLTVVEAMATGCPVIVARDNASDEVAGEAGLVVDADDAAGAARAIIRLVSDPAERLRRRAIGLERVAYFDRTRMARDYAALYRRLTA